MNLLDYVRARCVEDGDCLRWTGWLVNGHPEGRVNGRRLLIRRALFEQAHGPIPAGKVIRCICNTPRCVSEDHCVATTYGAIAKECGALGLMSGPVRSARIAATKRAGPQARITQDEARAIRVSVEPGTVLAARHGIAESTVSRIRRSEVRREYVGNPWAGLA